MAREIMTYHFAIKCLKNTIPLFRSWYSEHYIRVPEEFITEASIREAGEELEQYFFDIGWKLEGIVSFSQQEKAKNKAFYAWKCVQQ